MNTTRQAPDKELTPRIHTMLVCVLIITPVHHLLHHIFNFSLVAFLFDIFITYPASLFKRTEKQNNRSTGNEQNTSGYLQPWQGLVILEQQLWQSMQLVPIQAPREKERRRHYKSTLASAVVGTMPFILNCLQDMSSENFKDGHKEQFYSHLAKRYWCSQTALPWFIAANFPVQLNQVNT